MTSRAISSGLACLLLFAITSSPAVAGCDDSPKAGVDWRGCSKQKLIVRGERLHGARFDRTILTAMDFSGSDFTGASFVAAEFSRTSMREAKLARTSFEKAYAVRSNFSGAVLDGANLDKAEMQRCNFSGASLKAANLSKGDFGRSNFEAADLTGVNLRDSNLARASLVRAKLGGTDLARAFTYGLHVEGTDLSGVSGLTQAQVDAACGDARTRLPTGLKPAAGWPCKE